MSSHPGDIARQLAPSGLRRLPLAPAEGWLTLWLVLLMALTVAWAIDDVRWVFGNDAYTDFLVWAAVAGLVAGFTGAKMGLGRIRTHLVGAVMAGLLLPVLIGSNLVAQGAGIGEMFRATADSVTAAWIDLAILRRPYTREVGQHLLGLGTVVWGTAQFAAYAVFGHRRPLDAVIVVGLALLANMALTFNDQLHYLVLFSLAGLFLLARSHAFDQQVAWVQRRIGDPATVGMLYLRGGTVFIVTAVAAASLLQASASSAPLSGAWATVPEKLVSISQELQRYLPFGGASRPIGVVFGPTATITGSWTPDRSPAFTVSVDDDETERLYWRAWVHDTFELNGWRTSDTTDLIRQPGEGLLDGLADAPNPDRGREITFTVAREPFSPSQVVSPHSPVFVDREARVSTVGEAGYFSSVQLADGSEVYSVTALVPTVGDADPFGLTKNRLRAAGQDYPAEIRARYLRVPEGAIGPDAAALLAQIEALAGDNPFDLADTMRNELRKFQYRTNVLDLRCREEGLSVVECFARHRQGYCMYYASTMAILLRQAGVPTRLAEGFLPGDRDAAGVEVVYNSNAHAWVEVYFPGHGWIQFDPTGGGIAAESALPLGSPVASPTPGASPSGPSVTRAPDDAEGPSRAPGVGNLTPPPGSSSANAVTYIVLAILLAISVGALAFVAWQRGPRDEVSPDGAWRGVSRLASRLGFAPSPTETVYEYAGSLGDVLPAARPELHTVAEAKVEVAYGRHVLGEDRLRAIREAHRRLRLSLLRLALRRQRRLRRR